MLSRRTARALLHARALTTPVSNPSIYPHTLAQLPRDFDATKYRKWIEFGTLAKPKVSVMSFNLLSQHYVWQKVFGDLDQEYLDWPHYRFPLINETIEQFSSDIMCFQELESLVYHNAWQNKFPLKNYVLFYVRKPNPRYWGNKPPEFMDGVGIFINSDRFEVLDHRNFNFSRYIANNEKRFDITQDVSARVLPRNTVALFLKLRDKITDKIIYVTNTHLYWLPQFNDVKLIQAKLLLNELARMVDDDGEDMGNARIIMCGDYNSTPELLVYKLFANRKLDVQHRAEFEGFDYGHLFDGEPVLTIVKNPFALSPAYGPLLNEDNAENLEFTSFTKDLTEVLDHIWYSSKNFQVCKVLGKVEKAYCERARGFPDKNFPSDHIPLVTEFAYT